MASVPYAQVAGFVEDFAGTMVAAGVPRMPARVFAALLISDEGRLTSADLCERLGVSAGAVSGAVAYLAQVDLVHRVRPAGSRRDQYVVDTDVWQEVTLSQAAVLGRWVAQMEAGLALVADDSPAAERLRRSKDFFTFIDEEVAGLKERWEARRASWSGSV